MDAEENVAYLTSLQLLRALTRQVPRRSPVTSRNPNSARPALELQKVTDHASRRLAQAKTIRALDGGYMPVVACEYLGTACLQAGSGRRQEHAEESDLLLVECLRPVIGIQGPKIVEDDCTIQHASSCEFADEASYQALALVVGTESVKRIHALRTVRLIWIPRLGFHARTNLVELF